MDIVNHTKTISDMADNYNGEVSINKKFIFEMDEYPEEVIVTFIIKIYNSNNAQYLVFNQNGEYVGADIPGDINQDNTINVLDIVLLMGFILDFEEPTTEQFEAGDMNGDGILNIQDIIQIINIIIG